MCVFVCVCRGGGSWIESISKRKIREGKRRETGRERRGEREMQRKRERGTHIHGSKLTIIYNINILYVIFLSPLHTLYISYVLSSVGAQYISIPL